MRAEKRKKYIAIWMAALLVLSVPVAWVRAIIAADELTIHDYTMLSEFKTSIATANGDVLFRDSCVDPGLFGNLIGMPVTSKDENRISNSITGHYAEEMIPAALNPLAGIKAMTEEDAEQLLTTLLSVEAHEAVREAFASHDGICAAYNYVTGEVYMLLSLPSGLSLADDAPEGSLINVCLRGRVVPGSTMKLVAIICALDQGIDPNFTYVCTGELELPDGNIVKCHRSSGHGKLGLEDAVGLSCNTYMAALIQQLDVEQAQETLHRMGFLLNGEEAETNGKVSRLSHIYSRTTFDSNRKFNSVWGLVGQGESNVNPVHMLTVIGAIAGEGKTAAPYLVERIGTEEKARFQAEEAETLTLMDSETARRVAGHWRQATEAYYKMDERFTMLKTGTAQVKNGNNRLLMGVIEDINTAFYISVTGSSGDEIYDIANTLLSCLPDGSAE